MINPKPETLNPKQTQKLKIKKLKTVLDFVFELFGFI